MRLPPSHNRFNRLRTRTVPEIELAERMLLQLKKGEDARADRIAAARKAQENQILDTQEKLDAALDIVIDELEAEIEAAEEAQGRHLEKIEAQQISARPKVMYLISSKSRKPPAPIN
jgi:hypothetical protein